MLPMILAIAIPDTWAYNAKFLFVVAFLPTTLAFVRLEMVHAHALIHVSVIAATEEPIASKWHAMEEP